VVADAGVAPTTAASTAAGPSASTAAIVAPRCRDDLGACLFLSPFRVPHGLVPRHSWVMRWLRMKNLLPG
jgi:hypothetical protein